MGLATNIQQRKDEGKSLVLNVAKLDETTVDAKQWGMNFPKHYDAWKATADNERTKFGGSETAPVGDKHTMRPISKLETDPLLKTIFNGYAFALDYRERRGHAYMLMDQQETDRVKLKPQPGACMHCHASNVALYRAEGIKAGAPGDALEPATSEHGMAQIIKGWETLNPKPFNEVTKLSSHPVSCIDCHDPSTTALRVTRPGFIEGIRNLAKSSDPVPHLPSIEKWRKGDRKKEYDPNADATRQELRSMACGQCHVEYYFKGDEKRLTYPWHNGLKVEEIEAYYDASDYKDYVHADSKAPILKAQHPEFEVWSQGIHARSGVACADCHMPYKREGAVKISDHQVRSPLLNVARACQTCHHSESDEILSRVNVIQERHKALLIRAEQADVDLINAIKAAMAAGATDEQLKGARTLQRKAQWRTDFMNAENSMGFHAPQECARILGEAIDYARQGQVEVAKLRPSGAPAETKAETKK
jgi:nitrite reductase (cytochrome c-552)